MDYKVLIEQLRDESNCDVLDYVDDAADAIETLLAERDALLSEIKGDCYFCAFETGACVACDDGGAWQWRGPQKGGG